ncbi:MAG: Usg family protein [Ponticaulis sp.]|nr:Usg family protein [Ponticaulis sp.]
MTGSQSEFEARLKGAGLLTTDILYHMPDHPKLLQSFTWQTLDNAPEFSRLSRFLDFWRREIEAVIHSIRIAHADYAGPSGWRNVDEFIRHH